MDDRLDALSDKVRNGIPVDFMEALEVIEYQENLKAERKLRFEKSLVGRFFRWIIGL